VQLGVVDVDGNPVDATIQWLGPEDVAPTQTGSTGERQVQLRPGAWQVIASTDSLGPTRAAVDVLPSDAINRVELVLQTSRVALTGDAVLIKEQVQFDFGQATLSEGAGVILDEVANAILSRPQVIKVEVQGHSDSVGEVAYNQALSQRRSEAVLQALVDRGVPPENVVARGYGTQRPIATNDTDDGRAANRRVEFDIVEQAAGAPAQPEAPAEPGPVGEVEAVPVTD
jgi:outer membrane protein OmpA-like peptidoglycan-associated protein